MNSQSQKITKKTCYFPAFKNRHHQEEFEVHLLPSVQRINLELTGQMFLWRRQYLFLLQVYVIKVDSSKCLSSLVAVLLSHHVASVILLCLSYLWHFSQKYSVYSVTQAKTPKHAIQKCFAYNINPAHLFFRIILQT